MQGSETAAGFVSKGILVARKVRVTQEAAIATDAGERKATQRARGMIRAWSRRAPSTR